ncbi:MAG: hypothetical protein IJR93_04910 [Treponema sp.]|nr:hypothetical protein [Treponema sp.]
MQTLDFARNGEGRVMTDGDGKPRQEFHQFSGIEFKQGVFKCKKHGDVPVQVAILHGEQIPPDCPICKREKERMLSEQEAARAEEARRSAQIERYREMNIEREYWGKTLDDYKPLCESQAMAKAAMSRLIERKHGKVILLGTNGCGKTNLGSVAVMALGGKVLTMYEISCTIRQAYSPLAKRTELEIVEELATIPMLFIDEVGRSKGSAAELNWLSYVLDKRHQRGLPFGLGSNSHLSRDCPHGRDGCPQCFEALLGSDILSRLGQDTEIVTMYDAPDYRRRNR